MSVTMADLMPRVEQGAAWLDETKPGWFNEIDLEALDLGDCAQCALGQCFGSYGNGLLAMFPEYDMGAHRDNCFGSPYVMWAQAHGFERPEGGHPLAAYDALRECWITAILTRRHQQQEQQASGAVVAEAITA